MRCLTCALCANVLTINANTARVTVRANLNDIPEIGSGRAEGELAEVRHLVFLRAMEFQIVSFSHVSVVRLVAGWNTKAMP